MKRLCRIWYCEDALERLCCADCWYRADCAARCLNWPNRCGQCERSGDKPQRKPGDAGKKKTD